MNSGFSLSRFFWILWWGSSEKKKTKNRDKEVEPRRSDGCTVKIEKDEMKEE